MNSVVYRYRNNTYLKDTETELKLTENEKFLAKRVYLLSYVDILYKRWIVLDETTVHKLNKLRQEWMFSFQLSFSDCTYPRLKISFKHNGVRKNLFLSACFCWGSGLFLRKMDYKSDIGGLIVYGNSYLDSAFRYSKVFRLHTILHDAAGAVRTHSGKGPGYCYMIRRRPSSCLLGHVTGLLFCLYVKLFLPSNFSSVEF